MSGFLNVDDALKEWGDFMQPWKVGSWSDKVNNSQIGSPFHGLRAGKDLHELMSPTKHIYDRVQDIRKNGTDGHLGRTREQFHDYTKEAWDNNWPVAAAYAGGVAAGAGGGGAAGGGAAAGGGGGAAGGSTGGTAGASSGGSWARYGKALAGLGMQQQPETASPYPAPPTQQVLTQFRDTFREKQDQAKRRRMAQSLMRAR